MGEILGRSPESGQLTDWGGGGGGGWGNGFEEGWGGRCDPNQTSPDFRFPEVGTLMLVRKLQIKTCPYNEGLSIFKI